MAESEWLIIELSEHADSATYPELEAAIYSVFGSDIDFFLPIYHEKLGSYVSTNTLFEGYAFVRDTADSRLRLQNIKDSRYFIGALRMGGKIRTVDSYTIGGLRKKLKNSIKKKLSVGSVVKILEGIFVNLVGEVIAIEGEGKVVSVRIKCLSREIIAPIPVTCLEEVSCE